MLASLAEFIPGAEDSVGGGGEGSCEDKAASIYFQAFEMRKRGWGTAQLAELLPSMQSPGT